MGRLLEFLRSLQALACDLNQIHLI